MIAIVESAGVAIISSMLLELIELLQMAIGCPSCPRMVNNGAGLSVEKISRLVLDEHFLFIFD